MKYIGDSPIISNRVANVITDISLTIANLTMFQKISNILSIASFLLIVSTLISAFFGYKYVTSEQFKTKMMNKVLENVQGLMHKILDAQIADVTGPSMQLPKLK